jgi:hypothetical protein
MNEEKLNEVYDELWEIWEKAKDEGKTGVVISLQELLNIISRFDDGMGR